MFAARAPANNLKVRFSDFIGPDAARLPASAWRCFNTGGVDWTGQAFSKPCSVPQGKIQALWCGVAVPQAAVPGRYQGVITITPEGLETTDIKCILHVGQAVLSDAGDSEPWRHARLRWLDSTIAMDDEVVAPFTPLEVDGNTIRCLGRSIRLGANGLPEHIQSWFAPEMTHLGKEPRDILAGPMRLLATGIRDEVLPWEHGEIKMLKVTPGTVVWQCSSTLGPISLLCSGRME